jgi:hypothetical protein
MNHAEQLEFLLMIILRGSNIIEPRIIGRTIQFELDGENYIIKIHRDT